MRITSLCTVVALFVVLFAGNVASFAADSPSGKRNIVFLLADDLRPDGLSSLGNTVVKTPNLDALVNNGMIFRHAYVQGANTGAVCLPSRTMIQTGISYFRARGSTPTWAQTIKAAGYASIRSGKFGNNPNALDKDFDQHVDGETSEGNANNIIAFIQANAGKKPLFIYYAPHEPHDPQFATAAYYSMYKAQDMPMPPNFLPFHPFDNGEMTVRDEKTLPWPRTKENVGGKLARYWASTSYFDAHAGRIIDALKKAGQFDNTVFAIAGDNGLSLGEHGLLGKQNVYEFGGMHVPLIFFGPGVPKGETGAFTYLMDVYPTLCELAGVPVPSGLDAFSQVPVIGGKTPKIREVMFNAYRQCQRSIRDDRWKLIRYPLIDKTQLFDLQNDPHEMQDLAADPQQVSRIDQMMKLLTEQQKMYGDDAPLKVANPKPAAWQPPANGAAPDQPAKRRQGRKGGNS